MTDKSNNSEIHLYCGYIAIVGRPNVGKSTLLNHLLGQKISITSRKPQTTRHRIAGISTQDNTQFIYVDTPGLHKERKRPLNRMMNETVAKVLRDVDIVLFVIDRLSWTEEDELVLKALKSVTVPVVLIINKVDLLEEKQRLLPHLAMLAKKYNFTEIIPASALRNTQLDAIEAAVKRNLPRGPFLFAQDQLTDRSSRFVAAEIVREKITRQLGDELPYEVTVEIEKFEQCASTLHIHGLILVDKAGQKRIIIGKDGDRLKTIGTSARQDMEKMFSSPVMLKLWVKVRSGWADDERALKSLGYGD